MTTNSCPFVEYMVMELIISKSGQYSTGEMMSLPRRQGRPPEDAKKPIPDGMDFFVKERLKVE